VVQNDAWWGLARPEWWNGIHNALKMHRPKGHAGSNPASGTKSSYGCSKIRRCTRSSCARRHAICIDKECRCAQSRASWQCLTTASATGAPSPERLTHFTNVAANALAVPILHSLSPHHSITPTCWANISATAIWSSPRECPCCASVALTPIPRSWMSARLRCGASLPSPCSACAETDAPASRLCRCIGRACFPKLGRARSMSGRSCWSRGSGRSWRRTRGRLCVGCFTPTAAGSSTG
jgi:hypothetical protein